MRTLRLLHTSDVHLGGGFPTPEQGSHLDHCLCPLEAIERAAADHQVDLVVVVGDLFDNQRVPDQVVKATLDRLGRLGPPCVVINGNHDVHDEGSLYNRGHVEGSAVIFLDDHDGSVVQLFDGALSLWGKAMPIHDRSFRPLQDVPPRPQDHRWWVVLGHGHHEPAGSGAIPRSSPLTPEEIEATGADYVALGHWHVRTDVSTESVTAWYSGAPYGFAATEQFNLVDLDPTDGVTVRPVPVRLAAEGCGD